MVSRWCRGVSRGVEGVELAGGVEVSSWCRGFGVEVSRPGLSFFSCASPREIHYIAPPRELSCELCVCCASSSPDPVLQPVTARLARVGSRPPEPNRNRVQRVCACGPVLGATRWERLMTDLKSSHNGIRKRI